MTKQLRDKKGQFAGSEGSGKVPPTHTPIPAPAATVDTPAKTDDIELVWARYQQNTPENTVNVSGDTFDFFGPQGMELEMVFEQIRILTTSEVKELAAQDRNPAADIAWNDVEQFAIQSGRDKLVAEGTRLAWMAAQETAARANAHWDATRDKSFTLMRDTVGALIMRDIIEPSSYDVLTKPWRTVFGFIHPDDDFI